MPIDRDFSAPAAVPHIAPDPLAGAQTTGSGVPYNRFGDAPHRGRPYLTAERQARKAELAQRRVAKPDAPAPVVAKPEPRREGAGQGRAVRKDVREERLRPSAGLRGSPALALSGWRGRSERRYVVSVHDLAADLSDVMAAGPVVLVAVARDRETGAATPIDATRTGIGSSALKLWISAVTIGGATEMHCRRLCVSEAEAEAVAMDLCGPYPPAP